MKKVLIVGASGFIGKKLTSFLQENDVEVFEVSSKDGDVVEDKTLDKFLDKEIDHLYHLSAKTFVPDSWENPSTFFKVNSYGTINSLEFCRKTNASMTYVSSYMYGSPEELPIPESAKLKVNNPYAASKALAEQACEFYSELFEVKVSVFRPFNVYGTGQNEKFLIPFVIKQALDSDTITLKDMSPKRDYLFIDDLLNGLFLALNSEKQYAVYNLGSGESYSVREVVDIVQEWLGTKKAVVDLKQTRPNEIMDTVADVTLIKQDLNWEPKVSFKEGIKRIIDTQK